EAAGVYRQLAALRPQDRRARYALAVSLIEAARFRDAIAALEQLVQATRPDPIALEQRRIPSLRAGGTSEPPGCTRRQPGGSEGGRGRPGGCTPEAVLRSRPRCPEPALPAIRRGGEGHRSVPTGSTRRPVGRDGTLPAHPRAPIERPTRSRGRSPDAAQTVRG